MLSGFIPKLGANIVQSDRTEAISQYQNTLGADINWMAIGIIGGGIVFALILLKAMNSDQKRTNKKNKNVKMYKIRKHDDETRTDKLNGD